MKANVVLNTLVDAFSLNPNCQKLQEIITYVAFPIKPNDFHNALCNHIVTFLDEGSNLMANTFCHTSLSKQIPFMQHVIGIDVAPSTIIHIV